jgi:hypothetical protein
MGRFIDLTGQKFGRLTVQELSGRDNYRQIMWNCACDCGNTKRIKGSSLRSGATKSCGCYNREQSKKANITHGQLKDRSMSSVYSRWHGMIQRCSNPKCKAYKHYGGRGIKVCPRWLESFENFYEDMGDHPLGMSLDRKDNDGDYCKENCRWATQVEQRSNMRSNVWIDYKGETKTRTQWAHRLGMSVETLRGRLNRLGWSIERALTTPVS